MKRFLTRVLSGVLAVLIVYGVQAIFTHVVMPKQISKLAGTYVTEDPIDAESMEEILERYDFYPEEIALVEPAQLVVDKYVEFHEEKTYTFYYDVADFRADVENYFRDAFDSMYAGRSQLSALYELDMEAMSAEEFKAFYAELYSQASFDDLIAAFTEDAFSYDVLEDDTEVGTFTIEDGKILCTINGTYTAESMGYKLDGSTLTLTFSNDVEVYTRRN